MCIRRKRVVCGKSLGKPSGARAGMFINPVGYVT